MSEFYCDVKEKDVIPSCWKTVDNTTYVTLPNGEVVQCDRTPPAEDKKEHYYTLVKGGGDLAVCATIDDGNIGGNKCLQGPRYFCSSKDKYKKCVTDLGYSIPFEKGCEKYVPEETPWEQTGFIISTIVAGLALLWAIFSTVIAAQASGKIKSLRKISYQLPAEAKKIISS